MKTLLILLLFTANPDNPVQSEPTAVDQTEINKQIARFFTRICGLQTTRITTTNMWLMNM